jgi:GAF domain-containing protein
MTNNEQNGINHFRGIQESIRTGIGDIHKMRNSILDETARQKRQLPKEAQKLMDDLDELAKRSKSGDELMQAVARILNQQKLYYNWVGFYLVSKTDSKWLELGPYVGAMTPHTRIAMNQGICGAAASSGKTIVVDDVSKDSRYLACSVETKSEIVVPIFAQGKVFGELDIDSFLPAAFKSEDQQLVEYCAKVVGRFLEKHPR